MNAPMKAEGRQSHSMLDRALAAVWGIRSSHLRVLDVSGGTVSIVLVLHVVVA